MEALNPANQRPEFRAKIGRIAIENAPMCTEARSHREHRMNNLQAR